VIILDTNVLSRVMQDTPDPIVAAWLDSQPSQSIWTTSITVYELRFGIEILVAGRKRRNLETALDKLLENALDGRVLPFDRAAADAAGIVAASQRRMGRRVEIRDVQIAGITIARKATVATRNVGHFEGIGLAVVDPGAAA
jgi:predicted nucleic acid-binding protein